MASLSRVQRCQQGICAQRHYGITATGYAFPNSPCPVAAALSPPPAGPGFSMTAAWRRSPRFGGERRRPRGSVLFPQSTGCQGAEPAYGGAPYRRVLDSPSAAEVFASMRPTARQVGRAIDACHPEALRSGRSDSRNPQVWIASLCSQRRRRRFDFNEASSDRRSPQQPSPTRSSLALLTVCFGAFIAHPLHRAARGSPPPLRRGGLSRRLRSDRFRRDARVEPAEAVRIVL